MAQFMRDHALQLVHIVGRSDQPRMDEHILPAGDKCVDAGITHQHELHTARIKPGGIHQWPRNLPKKCLGLGIAQDGLRRRRAGQKRQGNRQQGDKDAHGIGPCLAWFNRR
jgi:hypothetical protein